VLTHKQGVTTDFARLTHFNSSFAINVSSSVIAYPKLCDSPSAPGCFTRQDSEGKSLVFNAVVSP
ncbi:MAG: hypothetical protein V1717_01355, partial [Candidatus Micrarchaeota archaeon]